MSAARRAAPTSVHPAVLLVAAAATGIAVFLAFPGWNLHALAWVAYVPLLVAARSLKPGAALRWGLLAGTVTNAGGFHWMTELLQEFGHLPTAVAWAILGLQAVTQGIGFAIGFGLWRWLATRGAASAPAAWLSLWAGEAVTPMIFPWFLGNAISAELPLIQIADLGGVHLVSALLYAANVALADALGGLLDRRRPAWRFVGATLLAVGLAAGYGVVRIDQVDAAQRQAPTLRIGMVEGNVGIWEKEAKYLEGAERARTLRHNLLKHQRLSAELEKAGAELIVWPESAYMPYGLNPVVHTLDRFLMVGAGGTVLRHDGRVVRAEPADRVGLPRDVTLLTALSSPRGDVWRAIDGGRRIVTVTPRGAHVTELPAGELAVATVFAPVDPLGRLQAGWVVARSGRVWRLDVAGLAPDPDQAGLPGPPRRADLIEVAGPATPALDITAAARNGQGALWLVGRRGAVAELVDGRVEPRDSPTRADLWAVAADAHGALLVAAGAAGTVLLGDGSRWVEARAGTADLFAVWLGGDGTAWVAGAHGNLWTRARDSNWRRVEGLPAIDLLAGAADADGRVLVVGRGGRVFVRAAGRGGFEEVAAGARGELTAVLGFVPVPSHSIPRSAARIRPSQAPLPAANLTYPAVVDADADVPEVDRTSPRRGFRAPLLFGAITHSGTLPLRQAGCTDCYNTALLLGPDGEVLDKYDKAFLLMFGEYLPFGEMLPQLYALSPETSRFQPGTRTAPIVLQTPRGDVARLGMLICYEDLVPRYAKKVATHDPHVLVNMTNDAWFGKTAEPEHHLNLALIRTVEYRRWLLRSTNTGISVFIDAVGRRVVETSLDGEETLLRDVPLLTGRTVYAALGDWALLGLALGLLVLTARAVRGRS
ncbi:MAG: apolipoprotein N-acyltransferase [Myxococcales bacterium]|nr:apolipoprotein N-acyltransferase [Myxococcales bacterium]